MTELYNWRTLAAQRFVGANVSWRGRYAVALYRDDKVTAVYLFEDEQRARSASLGWDGCKVIDLMPTPLPRKCPDRDYEDNREYR